MSVREDTDLARILVERLPAPSAARPVAVTDMIALRTAFWRTRSPVPIGPERQRRLDLGRALHRRLGLALAPEGALEVRVRADGCVGRIDLLGEVPTEVKTSSSSVAAGELGSARPDQVEQLAMYCAMSNRPSGRLITLVTEAGPEERIQAVEIEFGDTSVVRTEMLRRAELLRDAWKNGRADRLPACRWFGRGCEFQEAGACDCTGHEPPSQPAIISQVRSAVEAPDVSARLEARLRAVPASGPSPTLERFRDLLYPRRAYFERTRGGLPWHPALPNTEEPLDLYGRLAAAVEGGPLGEVTRIVPRTDEPLEEVGGFRGTPYLLRTSRARDRSSTEVLVARQPQYALELGFRCVATGVETGRLILGWERGVTDTARVQVFEFRFAPATAFAREWRERARLLADALAHRSSPKDLLPCPVWMFEECPYRTDCACGTGAARSQR